MGVVASALALGVAWLAHPLLRAGRELPSAEETAEGLVSLLAERADGEPVGQAFRELDPGAPYPPALVREPLSEEEVARFFPIVEQVDGSWTFDPKSYSRRAGHFRRFRRFGEHPDGGWTVVTNLEGMRESKEVAAVQPALRILVTGDSHTDGACANDESFTNLLEARLAAGGAQGVECLNAGAGGHNLYNYLGTWERFAHLAPDLFVVVVYGGNDFSSAVILRRYFERMGPFRSAPFRFDTAKLSHGRGALGPQELHQEVYFLNNPGDVQPAIDTACSISARLEELCAEAGTRLLWVYLPPPTRGQPERFRAELQRVAREVGLEGQELGVSDRIADGWLHHLDGRGSLTLDLREPMRSHAATLYWRSDHHLNLAGHRLVAELLEERVEALFGAGD